MTKRDPVRVWLRPLGQGCRVRVDNLEHATWLLERLAETNCLIGLEHVDVNQGDSGCRFVIPSASQRTRITLEAALQQLPGLQVMLEPEHN